MAIAVVIPTFMEVAGHDGGQRGGYIAGGLSAAVIDSEWVITAYLAANAFILPITGWLRPHRPPQLFSALDCRLYPLPRGSAAWLPAFRN